MATLKKISTPKKATTPKWKYQIEKKKSSYDTYLRFENEKEKKIKIKNWDFKKHPMTEALMTSEVIEEDGEKVDKVWSVWNYDFAQELKKRLKSKNKRDELELIIVRHEEDMEESFEVK